jgi:hypothetical protein
MEQEKKANAIEESTQEEDRLVQAIEQLNRLERLGSNRDSTRVLPRK